MICVTNYTKDSSSYRNRYHLNLTTPELFFGMSGALVTRHFLGVHQGKFDLIFTVPRESLFSKISVFWCLCIHVVDDLYGTMNHYLTVS